MPHNNVINILQVFWSLILYKFSLDQSIANNGEVLPLLGPVPGIWDTPQSKSKLWPALSWQRNGETQISNVHGGTTLLPWTPDHPQVPTYPSQQLSVVVWLCSGYNSPLSFSIGLTHWPYGAIKGWVSLTDPSLALQFRNHVMDEGHRVWLVWCCWWCTVVVVIGACCSLTFISPTAEGSFERPGKVFSCLSSSASTALIPKAQQCPFDFSPVLICAKSPWGLWAYQNGVILPFIPSHLSFQYCQLLGSPCHPRNRDRFCPYRSWWHQGTLCGSIN